MINNKRDLKNKCIVIPKKLSRKIFKKLKDKLKKLGFDNKIITFQDTIYGVYICVNSYYELSWYAGIVESNSKNITVEEFLYSD